MKKSIIAIVLVMMLVCVSFAGCGKSDMGDITVSAGESAIYIQEDWTVTYAICESFEEDYYDKGDLKDIIKAEIEEFNAGPSSSSMESAKLDSFNVKKDVATAVIIFKTLDDFVNYVKDYNGEEDEEIYIGTVSEAVDYGYKVSGDFTVVEDGKETEDTVKGAEVKENGGNIIYLKEQMIVQIEGADVKYVSANCEIKDEVITITDDEKAIIVY